MSSLDADPTLPSASPTGTPYTHPTLTNIYNSDTFSIFGLPTLSNLMHIIPIYYHPHLYISCMKVTHGLCQPMKKLQGGATAALAEDVASMYSHIFCTPTSYCVGLRVTADHISSAKLGSIVYALAIPVYIGQRMHVIDVICLVDESQVENDRHAQKHGMTLIKEEKKTSQQPYLLSLRPKSSHLLQSTISLIQSHPHAASLFKDHFQHLRLLSSCRVAMQVIPIPFPSDTLPSIMQLTSQRNRSITTSYAKKLDINIPETYDYMNNIQIGYTLAQRLRAKVSDNIQRKMPIMSKEVQILSDMTPHLMKSIFHVDVNAHDQPSNDTSTTPLQRCISFTTLLGMEHIYLSYTHTIARLIIQPYHLQPIHLVHGGVALGLIEEVGSTSAGLWAYPHKAPVGTHLEAHHISSARVGDILYVMAIPQHTGGATHVWDVTILAETKPDVKKKQQQQPQSTNEDAMIERLLRKQHPSASIHSPSHTFDQLYTLMSTTGITPMPQREHLRITCRGIFCVQLQPQQFPDDSARLHRELVAKAKAQLKSKM